MYDILIYTMQSITDCLHLSTYLCCDKLVSSFAAVIITIRITMLLLLLG